MCDESSVHAWCGLCYANRRGRANYKGHWGYRPLRRITRFEMAQFLRDRGRVEDPSAGDPEWVDLEMDSRYPCLREYLGVTQWADGTARKTSTLFVFADGTCLKGMVKDRDRNKVAFFTAETWEELLDRIERALLSGSADWRVDRQATGRGRTK